MVRHHMNCLEVTRKSNRGCWAAYQGEAPKRAITGAEFFHRFPLLHSYLLGQLEAAAEALRSREAQLHPSLYPILVLLSRLRPSLHSRNAAQVRCPLPVAPARDLTNTADSFWQ